jgi:hypothetical protein
MSFGKRNGGGRRSAKRVTAPLPALLITMSDRHPALLFDISEVGAQLRARDAPKKGLEVFLQVGDVDVYAQVVWSKGDVCGLKFCDPIRGFDLHQLAFEAAGAAGARISPAQKGGVDDWKNGVAR